MTTAHASSFPAGAVLRSYCGPYCALSRPVPFRPARAEVHLESDALRARHARRRHAAASARRRRSEPRADGVRRGQARGTRVQRRFVRMLILEGARRARSSSSRRRSTARSRRTSSACPRRRPRRRSRRRARGKRSPTGCFGGGRLAALSIADLARLACIATPQFAVLIGEVAAQRALELAWGSARPAARQRLTSRRAAAAGRRRAPFAARGGGARVARSRTSPARRVAAVA